VFLGIKLWELLYFKKATISKFLGRMRNLSKSYSDSLKRIPTFSKIAAILYVHVIHSTLCFIYFSNLIEEKGLNLTNSYALCWKVLLGENVADLFEGGDLRQSKKEVV
jgi:hypothetical protein